MVVNAVPKATGITDATTTHTSMEETPTLEPFLKAKTLDCKGLASERTVQFPASKFTYDSNVILVHEAPVEEPLGKYVILALRAYILHSSRNRS